jgi:diguanylate cyclase (GGDEF)-like protein/PAS domain S-box-containing protein
MQIAPLPSDEQERLATLKRYNILDTEPEPAFDAMVQLASHICKTPIAVISLIDEHRQWFKAVVGLDVRETPRDVAFCAHTVFRGTTMIVRDALEDERFVDNPLVIAAPHMRFYAGVPLVASNGQLLGTLCVIDRVPRDLAPDQLNAIETLAANVMAYLELRLSHKQSQQYLDELHRTQTQLQARQDLLVKLSLHVPGMIYQYRLFPDGRSCFPYASIGINDIYEVTPEQVVDDASPVYAILHPDDYDAIVASIQESARTMQTWHLEYRVDLPKKGVRWLLGQAGPESLADGSILWHGFITDITERKHAEAAFAESRNLLQVIIDSAPVRIFWKDRESRYLGCNPAFARDAGVAEPSDLVGKDDTELGWREQAALYRADDRRVMDTGIAKKSYDEPQTTPDGNQIWLRTSKVPLFDPAGEAIGVLGIYEDITEYKQAEQQLRIAATAFESQEGIIVTDADGIVLRINQAAVRITGYSSAEIVGKTPHLLRSGRHDATFYKTMWDSIHRSGTWESEIWNRHKNGEIYPEHITITAVKDAEGNVTHYVATFNDITLSKKAEDEIRNLAFYDPLTRLPNRRLLLDRLRQALAASTRSCKKGALLFIDLDNFKTLNDTLGHDIGDLLLQQVADRLIACVREDDTVARLGGDEFVVMLEDLSEQDIEAAALTETVCKKILEVLDQPYRLAMHDYRNTASIGATLFKAHELAIEELLRQADIAMYQAKKAGRNMLQFFDPQMQENITARVALEGELRRALEYGQFRLHYQIQVGSGNRPLGAEALIRWVHPERGLLSPAVFIPLAEETGIILSLGLWVLETACVQLKQWECSPLTSDLQLAINVSALQFHQSDFVEQVREALHSSGAKPDRLKLELTESLVLKDIDDTVRKMEALRRLGVRFAMDDFGTGHSSLSSLKRLPLDQLKIDQSFVRDIVVDVDDAIIVQTIIAMANNLGMDVIAEGVETEAQRDFLARHGCPVFQGYLFGKPIPADEFESLLQQFVRVENA